MYLRTVKIQQYFWFKLFFFFQMSFNFSYYLMWIADLDMPNKQNKSFWYSSSNHTTLYQVVVGWDGPYLIISLLFWGFIFLIYSQFICHIEIYPLSRWSALTLAISILMLFRCTARCCLLRLSVAAICTFIFS